MALPSPTLLRVWGIPVRLHWSFLLLAVGGIAWRYRQDGPEEALFALAIGTVLFGSVLLHELGHARVGMAFGLRTRDITLHVFGGVAALRLEPTMSRAELWIALAGPGVNAGVALIALGLRALGVPWMLPVILINTGMALFNLLPAYPMDGGRVLRAWWAPRLGVIDATLRAIRISRLFGWGFLLGGTVGGPSVGIIGLFLLLATTAERRHWEAMAMRVSVARRWANAALWAPAGAPFGWRGAAWGPEDHSSGSPPPR